MLTRSKIRKEDWDFINEICRLNEEGKHKCCKFKHPQSKKAKNNALLKDIPKRIYAFMFESIYATLVREAATKTRRGFDPSGMDADGCRQMKILVKHLLKLQRNFPLKINLSQLKRFWPVDLYLLIKTMA